MPFLRKPAFEHVVQMPGRSFDTEYVVGPVLNSMYHFHPEIEITHILSSHGVRIVGDCAEEFHAGDLALFGGNLPHVYHNRIGDSNASDWARARNIKFTLESLGAGFFELPEMWKVRLMLERADVGLWFPEPTASRAGALLAGLFGTPDGPERIVTFLNLLTVMANETGARELSGRAPVSRGAADKTGRLYRVIGWIHANAGRKIGLKEAAAVACLSPESFSRFFKKAIRKRFVDYLTETRLSRASQLLLESDNSISRIAMECGFANLSNFNRRFLRFRRMTPHAYRVTVRSHSGG